MKRDWFLESYIAVVSLVIVAVAYLDLGNYTQILSNQTIQPKHIYYILALLAAPIYMFRRRSLYEYLTSRSSMWAACFVFLNVFHILFYSINGDADKISLTLTRIQFLILSVLLSFVLIQARARLLAFFFLGTALMLTCLQVYDFLSPGVITPMGTPGVVIGRAASTLINANKPAESLLLLSLLGVMILKPSLRIVLLLLILPGILVSFSRGGMLVWLCVFILGSYLQLWSRKATTFACILALVFIYGGALVDLADILAGFVDPAASNSIYRRTIFTQSHDLSDGSASERLLVLNAGIDTFLENPLWGKGAGYTSFWSYSDVSVHNQGVLILAEYGLIGFALFAYLLLMISRRSAYLSSLGAYKARWIILIATVLFSFFTHNMFDNLYWLISFVLVGHSISQKNVFNSPTQI